MLFILHSVGLYEIFTIQKTKMKEMMLVSRTNAALLSAPTISKIIGVKLAKLQDWGVRRKPVFLLTGEARVGVSAIA